MDRESDGCRVGWVLSHNRRSNFANSGFVRRWAWVGSVLSSAATCWSRSRKLDPSSLAEAEGGWEVLKVGGERTWVDEEASPETEKLDFPPDGERGNTCLNSSFVSVGAAVDTKAASKALVLKRREGGS